MYTVFHGNRWNIPCFGFPGCGQSRGAYLIGVLRTAEMKYVPLDSPAWFPFQLPSSLALFTSALRQPGSADDNRHRT